MNCSKPVLDVYKKINVLQYMTLYALTYLYR